MNLDSLSREELKEQAELLGLDVSGKESTDTLKRRIASKLGEPVDEPELAHASVATDEERITIILNESEADKQPVVVGVNGRNYVMQRGKPVSVPKSVLEVLNHAYRTVWDGTMSEYNEVMRYPYRVQM